LRPEVEAARVIPSVDDLGSLYPRNRVAVFQEELLCEPTRQKSIRDVVNDAQWTSQWLDSLGQRFAIVRENARNKLEQGIVARLT